MQQEVCVRWYEGHIQSVIIILCPVPIKPYVKFGQHQYDMLAYKIYMPVVVYFYKEGVVGTPTNAQKHMGLWALMSI